MADTKNTPLPELTPYTGSFVDNVLRIALDIGEGLLMSGADVRRVEFAIEKISRAYGAAHVDVFSIHSLILAAVYMPDGTHSTQSRRILDTANHLTRIELYNALSREICETVPPIDAVDARIREIKKKGVYPFGLTIAAHFLSAAAFAVFFGGSLLDGLAAGLIAIVMAFLDRIKIDHINKTVKITLISFIAGILSCLAVRVGVGDSIDMIIVGTIMILIPGLSLGNSMRDLLSGDTLTGTLKVVQAVITSAMMALGYALALILLGGGL